MITRPAQPDDLVGPFAGDGVVEPRPDPAESSNGSTSVLVLSVGLLLGGAGVAEAATSLTPEIEDASWLVVLTFTVALVLAGCLSLKFRYRNEVVAFDLFEAMLAPVIFAIQPRTAVAMVVVAMVVSEAILRVRPVKAIFNVASWTAAAGVGSYAYALMRTYDARITLDLVALAVACAFVALLNDVLLIVVLRLVDRRPLTNVVSTLAPVIRHGWLVGGSLNIACGVLSAAAYGFSPVLTPLLLVPLVLLHLANQGQAASRADHTRLEGMRRAATALALPVDPRSALPVFLEEVRVCLQTEVAELLLDTDGRKSLYSAHDGGAAVGVPVPAPAVLAAALEAAGEPTQVRADERSEVAAALRAEGWRDCLSVPVRIGDRTVGVLYACNRTGLKGFEDGEQALAGSLASELGSALQKGELLDVILEERRKSSEIVNSTSEGIATIAPDGTVLSWNPSLERLTGWVAGEIVGQCFDVLEPTSDGDDALPFSRWPDDDVRLTDELEVLRPDGERRWLSASYAPVADPSGDARLLILVVRDATATRSLRRAQEELTESAERFEAMVQNSSDMLTVLDRSGTITYSSPGTGRTLGYPEGALVGRNVLSLIHEHDLEAVRDRLPLRRATDPFEVIRARIRGVDGAWHDVETLATNLLDNPSVGGVVLNSRDITERTRSEALLAGQAGVLELIAQDAPLTETLTSLAGVVEAQAPSARCAFLLLTEDGLLEVVASPTMSPRAVAEVDGLQLSRKRGWAGAAMAQRRSVFAADLGAVPSERNDLAAAEGIAACWALPIMGSDGEHVLGSMVAFLHEPRLPNAADRRLVELSAYLAAIAVERVRSRATLAHQATHDPLTGLPNRVVFLDRASTALARSDGTGSSAAVLFVDLDRFKVINDSLGHEAGDRLLTTVASRLSAVVRPGDTLARFGGDEFTILCEGITDEGNITSVAERVREALASPFNLDGSEVFVTASIGIAIADAELRPEALLENADAAMYRAKDRGGDHYELFDQAMRTRARTRLATQNALHRAIEREEFRVFYQPTLSLRTGRVVGVEALVRWEHPRHGLMLPEQFIDLAEETGLIIPVGGQVLAEAFRQAERWRVRPGGDQLVMSVNLSARQFAHPDLVGVVADALERTSTDARNVCLEITESVLMDDALHTETALRDLKTLGLGLHIDDFGTGYSSLAYLKRFPVDGLKVDRSFVDGLGTDPGDTAIVAAVVNLAHTLGLVAVAEGVETPDQLARLRALGCDIVQGYYVGRPVPADQVVFDLVV